MYNETATDLNILYEGTYASHIDNFGNKLVYHLSEFFEDEGNARISCKNVNEGDSEYFFWEEIEDSFNFKFPELGAINCRNSVLLITRKLKQNCPTRYRRGLRNDSVLWFDPSALYRNKPEWEKIPTINKTFAMDFLSPFLYFPIKMSYLEAISSILNGTRVGAAFDNQYYFTLDPVYESIFLWRNTNIIGTYNPSKDGVILNSNWFSSNLEELGVNIIGESSEN